MPLTLKEVFAKVDASEDTTIGLVKDEQIFYLVLNNGQNMFNMDQINKWHKILDIIEGSRGPAVLITIAKGDRIFSTGFDLAYWGQDP